MIDEIILNRITENLIACLKDNTLTLKIAKEIIEKAERKANEIKVAAFITVVDAGGNLIAAPRMDDSMLISISASFNKALYSNCFKNVDRKTLRFCSSW